MSEVKTLEDFYSSKCGEIFRYFLHKEFSAALADNAKTAGLGYTAPYKLPNCINLSSEAVIDSVQISENQLPFRNAELNQVVAIHYLENISLPFLAVQEIWRVLEPAGRLLLVVPNQKSLWKDTVINGKEIISPQQVREMLIANKFHIHKTQQAIFHPPAITSEFAKLFRYLPFFGAVTIYHAQKFIFPNRGKPIKISESLRDLMLTKKKTAQQ